MMTDIAYHDGKAAREGDVTKQANPYCPITQAASWSAWMAGWHDANYAAKRDARSPKPTRVERKFRPIIW